MSANGFKRKDGYNVDAEVWGALTLDYRGQPIGMVVSSQDITDAKAAEARLRESENRYRTLVENSISALPSSTGNTGLWPSTASMRRWLAGR